MFWQLIVVAVIVLLAAAYLVRQTWRAWSARRSACGGGCGCTSQAAPGGTAIPLQQLTLRRRDGDGS